jgi:hypothetical protein
MKILCYWLIFFVVFEHFCFSQNNAIAGLYLDGHKSNSISCCNFKNIHLVIPIDTTDINYPFFNLWVRLDRCPIKNKSDSGVAFMPQHVFLKQIKKGHFIYELYNENEGGFNLLSSNNTTSLDSPINKKMMCDTFCEKTVLTYRVEALKHIDNNEIKKNTIKLGQFIFTAIPLSKNYRLDCLNRFNCDLLPKHFILDK